MGLCEVAQGCERHSQDFDLMLQTESQRMTRSDLSGSDKKWGTERRQPEVWELLAVAGVWRRLWPGRGIQHLSKQHLESPKPAVPTTEPLRLLRVSQNRRSCPPVFSGALCFLPPPSSPPPSISLACSKIAFHPRITEASDADTPRGSDFL